MTTSSVLVSCNVPAPPLPLAECKALNLPVQDQCDEYVGYVLWWADMQMRYLGVCNQHYTVEGLRAVPMFSTG